MSAEEQRKALIERLRDLSYRGRCMTGPEAATYADFILAAGFRLIDPTGIRGALDGLEFYGLHTAQCDDVDPSKGWALVGLTFPTSDKRMTIGELKRRASVIGAVLAEVAR